MPQERESKQDTKEAAARRDGRNSPLMRQLLVWQQQRDAELENAAPPPAPRKAASPPAPRNEEGGSESRPRRNTRGDATLLAGGYTTGPFIDLFNAAGPLSAGYASHAGLGLDAAGRPVIGGHMTRAAQGASPQALDKTVGYFMDNMRREQEAAAQEAPMRQAVMQRQQRDLLARLQAYQ
jgi:hypothetical protein